MAMNGTEKTSLYPPLSSLDIENNKINGGLMEDIDGRIKECMIEKVISKDLSNESWCSANYRRVFHPLHCSMIVNVILITTIFVLASLLSLERRAQERREPACSTIQLAFCPDGWVGYQRKCYYFAEAERNWTSSKMSCSSFNASLAVVESQDEMDFLTRYKTSADHWIGLQRDLETEPWKWIDGTIFNNWFQVRGGGECAYLNNRGVASSFCTREEPWICSKPINR